ncbi:MAG: ABC transporter permease [Clostridia bacterium]|nr:ABC transporter permease [Clostridia bacterium]
MAETTTLETPSRERGFRHRGRTSQIPIYLGKQFRFFVNESDWKVLPMAAIIAALVAMVIRKRLFINMEGSLMGAFALACVAIWNGCFNSIQAVCRERQIIKREHRSGMHITSYVAAHMIYQFLLCLAQTGVTMYVLQAGGIQFPEKGFMTPFMILDVGISMLLIAYASDMMSLFISSVSRTTTGAMTVMPFVLIFQLVFSGGILPLPEWVQPLSKLTVSSYGIRAIAAQSGYNELPMVTAWNTLSGMRDTEIGGEVTADQLLTILDSEAVSGRSPVLAETVKAIRADSALRGDLSRPVTVKLTVGELLEMFGEERVRTLVQTKTAEASRKPEYEKSVRNIVRNWLMLGLFIAVFAGLAILSLELIDKDRR